MKDLVKMLLPKFSSPKVASSYKTCQAEVEQKLSIFIHYFMTFVVAATCLTGFIRGIPSEQLLIRTSGLAILVGIHYLKRIWPKWYNPLFLFFFWGLYSFSNLGLINKSTQTSNPGVYITGYLMGMGEIMVAFTVSNILHRIIFQFALMLSKIVIFSDFLSQYPISYVLLLCWTLAASYFFICYHGLIRAIFKVIYASREKTKKFQTLLENDFPISFIILASNLTSAIFSNQCFIQNFGDLSKFGNPAKAIEELFKKFVVEQDCQSEDTTPSHHASLLEHIKCFSYFKQGSENKEVLTLYAVKDKDQETQSHYEIKLRKIIWEDEPAFTLILNDVSDKQLVRGLRLADEQKDRVIATVSHELRTPINGILGFLEMVISQVTDKLCLTYLDHCKNCSKLLLYLVNSILDLSQIRHNSLKVVKDTFDLDKLIEEVKSLYFFSCQYKGIQFVVEKDLFLPKFVYTDQYRLMEVLINLISNAMKFTIKGFIKLRVTRNKLDPTKLSFHVQDTGIGISEEDRSKLFKMFGKLPQTQKNINSHGVGLGLTIANELVKALNDNGADEKVEFASTPNKGSEFWFNVSINPRILGDSDKDWLEDINNSKNVIAVNKDSVDILRRGFLDHRLNKQASSCLSPKKVPSDSSGKSLDSPDAFNSPLKQVLIVDDNPFNLMVASFMIKKLGCIATTASSGEECLKILENSLVSDVRYALVLMDIQMPVMDGLEATEAIYKQIKKGRLYQVPIVALTAKKVDEKEKAKYIERGMFDVLEKPLEEAHMRQILTNIFNLK